MKIQFEIPWQPSGLLLPVAVTESEAVRDMVEEGMVGRAFLVECDSSGALLVNFPLSLFLRSLMQASPEIRKFTLDTIGKDAPMVHFGLVELRQPEGGE